MIKKLELWLLLIAMVAVLLWSWFNPYDRLTWWMEALPVLIGIVVLVATRAGFPLTRLLYYLLFIYGVILVVGAHYSYARVPLGFWLQELLDFQRNPYDRLGHLAQGFIPAILAREILIRNAVVKSVGWLFFLVMCICLAFSALYELIEWWAAVIGGDGSVEFLGTQGDVWDAQWDMLHALIGALAAQLLLSGVLQRQINSSPWSSVR